MFERFTPEARDAVIHAQEEARRHQHAEIGTEHVLLGVLHVAGPARDVLSSGGLDLDRARDAVASVHPESTRPTPRMIPLTAPAKQTLEDAHRFAKERRDPFIGPEHLLLALLDDEDSAASGVVGLVADVGTVRARLNEALDTREVRSQLEGATNGDQPGVGPVCFACRVPLGDRTGLRVVLAEGDRTIREVTLIYCRRCGTTLSVLDGA